MKYLKIGGTWLLQLLLTAPMVGPGMQKFTGDTWERMFRRWGYPDGFYLVIGAVEVVAGVGLLIPRVTSYCAIVLSVVMLGASATQILRGGRNGVGEVVLALLLALIAWIRWRDRMRVKTVSPLTAS
jgi:putative oxidoreductase